MGWERIKMVKLIVYRSREERIMLDWARKCWEDQLTGRTSGGMTLITIL